MPTDCTPSKPGAYPSDCEIIDGYREMARNRTNGQSRTEAWTKVLPKAKSIRLLLLDVDGVLTDGSITYSQDGNESKTFNTQDGFGLRLLQDVGVEVGVITARKSEAVTRRANDLKMGHVYQGAANKLTAFKEITKKTGLKPFEIAYMGDDWLDLVLLKRVGLALAPGNAVDAVTSIAHYTTIQTGGHGAVREVCELILEAQGKLDSLRQEYTNR